MPDVMSDDSVCPACYGQLEQELVAGVGQCRSQPEIDVGLAAQEAEGADDGIDRAFRNLETLRLTLRDGLILKDQGHGDQRDPTLTDPLQDGEGCASSRPKGRDDDVRIQDEAVHGAGCFLLRFRLENVGRATISFDCLSNGGYNLRMPENEAACNSGHMRVAGSGQALPG